MSIRPKTKRRLVILLSGLGLLVVLAVGAWFARQWQLERRAAALRENGMAAAQKGDWPVALDQLARYINRHRGKDDAEVLYQFARARIQVQLPESKHLVQAALQLRRLLTLKPDDAAAQQLVLEVYSQLGASTEAIAIADKILGRQPDHVQALRARAVGLTRLRRNADALTAAEAYLKVKPDDLSIHLLCIELLQRLGKPVGPLVARAEGLQKAHPEDPRFELLLACAYRAAQDPAKSLKWLRAASARPAPDAEYLKVVVGMLESGGMFAEARALLEKSAGADAGPEVLTALASRLWENGQDKELLARFEKLDPQDANTHADLLGYKALALARLDRQEEARPLAEALRGRVNAMRAQAWSVFLDQVVLAKPGGARGVADACRKAQGLDAGIAAVHAMAGQAYTELGERELALREWRDAAKLSPSWSLPLARMARLLAEMGRNELAAVAAREAGLRSPTNGEAAVAWVVARAASLTQSPGRGDSPEKLLEMIEELHKAMPGEPQTLVVKVELLLQMRKRDAAAAAIRQVIDAADVPAGSLLRLAQASRSAGLGLEEACLARHEKIAGRTADATLFRALGLLEKGQADQGRKLLEAGAVEAVKDPASLLRWRLALAEYAERSGAADAATVVSTLADAEPGNMVVQQSVLRSQTAAADRKLMERTIERLRTLTGEDSVGWKLARARWLLGGENKLAGASAALALLQEVTRSAPDMLEARLLTAQVFDMQGNRSASLEELKAARNLAPGSTDVALDLAAMLQSGGDAEGAGSLIDEVLKSPTLSNADRRRVAQLLAARGQADRSIELLKKSGGGEPGRGDLLLAVLLRSRNELDAAEAEARKVLAHEPGLPAIEFTADLLASRGREDQAREVLALLEKVPVGAAARAMALARYAQNRGRADEALGQYRKATQAEPTSAIAWRALLAALARRGDAAELASAAAQAAKAMPGDLNLAAMREHAALAVKLGAQTPEMLRPLVAAVVDQPERQAQAVDALRVAVEGVEQATPGDQVLTRLAPIADRAGGFVTLQLLMARMHMALRHWEDAANLAARALQQAPSSSEAAALATQALSGGARWDEALASARKWRQLSGAHPRAADLFIADLLLHTGQPDAALRTVEPYVKAAKQNPEDQVEVLSIHAQALAAKGRLAEAAEGLAPLLASSPRCRLVWLEMTAAAKDAATATRWLDQANAAMPAQNIDERISLAQTYLRVGQRLNHAGLSKAGRDQLEQLASRPDATALAVLNLALLLDAPDPAQAEKLYRRALTLDKESSVARNNLAMLLVRRAGDNDAAVLAEALTLATEAVKAAPGNGDFIDSLATVQAKMKDYDKAIQTQRQAIRVAPDNPYFRLALAQVLVTAGKTTEAGAAVAEIDALANRGVALTAEMRTQLESLRRATQGKPVGPSAAVKP